jgi:NADH dehydrogenase/NADH:ubiquinone oxidoreductase subunit G
MSDNVNLIIDGNPVTVPKGSTILNAVRLIGIEIPSICYHDHCTSNAVCRTCVVEVEGSRVLVASCIAQVSEGMVVSTHSERVERSRRTIFELLDSAIDLSDSPEILKMLVDNKSVRGRFPGSKRREPALIDDNPMYIRDYAKCILCWRCVQVCSEDAQYTYAINYVKRGFETQIGTFFDKPLPETTCVFCGQCVGVCPTGALKPKREWLLELKSKQELRQSKSVTKK